MRGVRVVIKFIHSKREERTIPFVDTMIGDTYRIPSEGNIIGMTIPGLDSSDTKRCISLMSGKYVPMLLDTGIVPVSVEAYFTEEDI